MVAGHVAVPATVMITVTRAGSQLAQATAQPFPDENDYFYAASPYWPYCASGGGCPAYGFHPGDVVWVTQLNTSISMTVPTLSALAEANTDRVFGAAPIGQPVTVYLFSHVSAGLTYSQIVTSGVDGQYSADWTAIVDVQPRDSGYVAYAEAPGRQAYVRFATPFLRAQVNGWEISGVAAPRSQVAITATDSDGTPRARLQVSADANGSFQILFNGWPAQSTAIQSGDRIVATAAGQYISTTVASLTAHADSIGGLVWGEGPIGRPIEVARYAGPLSSPYDYLDSSAPAEAVTATVAASGNYSAALSLGSGNYGAVYVTTPDGNQTFARFAVPWLKAQLGKAGITGYSASGQVDDPSALITITIQGPSGYPKDIRHVTAYDNGFFLDDPYNSSLVLDSGDVITVDTSRGTQVALTFPFLPFYIHSISDTISCLAPPVSLLTLTFYSFVPIPVPQPPLISFGLGGGGGGGYPYTIIVTATAQGDYQIDLSGILDLVGTSTGQLEYTTPQGHVVTRVFGSDGNDCSLRPSYAYIGGNHLGIESLYGCAQLVSATLSLRDAQGQIKAVRQLVSSGVVAYSVALYSGTQPIPILAGDTIEIDSRVTSGADLTPTPYPLNSPTHSPTLPSTLGTHASDRIITTSVPTLTAILDPIANTITGQAPPDATLYLELYRADVYRSWLTTTVSAQGNYSISLAGLYTLTPGDRVRVTYSARALPSFYAVDTLPMLQATLHQSVVDVWLPPLTPFTTTLESAGVTTHTNSYASETSASTVMLAPLSPGDTLTVTTLHESRRLNLPFLSAHIDRQTATVSGQAPPNARLEVDIRVPSAYAPGTQLYTQIVTATAGGSYTATFTNLAPLSTVQGTLTYFDTDGDQARLDFATPSWQVVLGSACVAGSAEVVNMPITVTLQDKNGAFKDRFTSYAQSTSGVFAQCFPTATVQPSDRLTLSYAQDVLTYTVPVLTAEHDYARQVLRGEAPPNTPIAAALLSDYSYQPDRHTFTDSSGHYGFDTSDLHPAPGQSGYVIMTDAAGNTVRRYFTITGYRSFLPLIYHTQP